MSEQPKKLLKTLFRNDPDTPEGNEMVGNSHLTLSHRSVIFLWRSLCQPK